MNEIFIEASQKLDRQDSDKTMGIVRNTPVSTKVEVNDNYLLMHDDNYPIDTSRKKHQSLLA